MCSSASSDHEIPHTTESWEQEINRVYGRLPAPPPHNKKWSGISDIKPELFLRLRTIWPNWRRPAQSMSSEQLRYFGLFQQHREARSWLQKFPPFKAYLRNVRDKIRTPPWYEDESDIKAQGLGIMDLPKRKQEIIIDALNSPRRSVDEEMVASSLITFLEAITMRYPGMKCDWSSQRKKISTKIGRYFLQGYADGWLINPITKNVKALLETKKSAADVNGSSLARQITGEFVASLGGTVRRPDHGHFFVMGQYGTEIYIFVASSNSNYANYLKEKDVPSWDLKPSDFMEIMMFGPWGIDNAEELLTFASIALAIAIKGSQ